MIRGSKRIPISIALLAALAVLLGAAGCGENKIQDPSVAARLTIEEVKLTAADLGGGWRLEDEVSVDPGDADADSPLADLAALGATRVVNQVFARDGERLQVNYVQMKTVGEAELAAEAMAEDTGENVYLTRGRVAVEIIGEGPGVEKAGELMGMKEAPGDGLDTGEDRDVTASFELACVDGIDYMHANELSVFLGEYQDGEQVNPSIQGVIDGATFGNTVALLTESSRSL